jgi:photosystem II stability/assembly factor-like uncharacterized protein
LGSPKSSRLLQTFTGWYVPGLPSLAVSLLVLLVLAMAGRSTMFLFAAILAALPVLAIAQVVLLQTCRTTNDILEQPVLLGFEAQPAVRRALPRGPYTLTENTRLPIPSDNRGACISTVTLDSDTPRFYSSLLSPRAASITPLNTPAGVLLISPLARAAPGFDAAANGNNAFALPSVSRDGVAFVLSTRPLASPTATAVINVFARIFVPVATWDAGDRLLISLSSNEGSRAIASWPWRSLRDRAGRWTTFNVNVGALNSTGFTSLTLDFSFVGTEPTEYVLIDDVRVTARTCEPCPGYFEPLCYSEIMECASSPCPEDASCLDEINWFACQCPVESFGPGCSDQLTMTDSFTGTAFSSLGDFGIAVGTAGRIFRSTDRGITWGMVANPTVEDFVSVQTVDEIHALERTTFVATTRTGVFYTSTDSGATWQPTGYPNPNATALSLQRLHIISYWGCYGGVMSAVFIETDGRVGVLVPVLNGQDDRQFIQQNGLSVTAVFTSQQSHAQWLSLAPVLQQFMGLTFSRVAQMLPIVASIMNNPLRNQTGYKAAIESQVQQLVSILSVTAQPLADAYAFSTDENAAAALDEVLDGPCFLGSVEFTFGTLLVEDASTISMIQAFIVQGNTSALQDVTVAALQHFNQALTELVSDDSTQLFANDVGGVVGAVFAVGNSGALHSLGRLGAGNWTSTALTSSNLYGIAVATDGRALVVGENGAAFQSSDWGQTWTDRTSVGTRQYRCVAALSGDNFVVAGVDLNVFSYPQRNAFWIFTPDYVGMQFTQQPNEPFAVSASENGDLFGIVGAGDFIEVRSGDGQPVTYERNDFINYRAVANSADGTIIVAVGSNTEARISVDGGLTSTIMDLDETSYYVELLDAVDMSADGSIMLAGGQGGRLFVSNASGAFWIQVSVTGSNIYSTAVSSSGQIMMVSDHVGNIHYSTDAGMTWGVTATGSSTIRGVAMSSDGSVAVAVGDNSAIFRSTDTGASWVEVPAPVSYMIHLAVALSETGQYGVVVGYYKILYVTRDYGVTWASVELPTPLNFELNAVAMNGPGTNVIVVGTQSQVWQSVDLSRQHRASSWRSITLRDNFWGRAVVNVFTGVTMSRDGDHVAIVAEGNHLFVSESMNGQ